MNSINTSYSLNVVKAIHKAISSTLSEIARRISLLIFGKVHFDQNELLKGKQLDPNLNAWHLNLALLRQVKQISNPNPQIDFLATNYLSKATPIHLNWMSFLNDKVRSLFQVNGFAKYFYHRSLLYNERNLGSEINKTLAMGDKSPLILTDTVEFDTLLPLKFTVNPESMLEVLEANPLDKPLERPFLFDVTHDFRDLIKKGGKEFDQKLKEFKATLNSEIENCVEHLHKRNPSISKSNLRKFIQNNITCICRVELENMGGIKVLPLFKNLEDKNLLKNHFMFVDFITTTGILIGAVNLRRYVLNAFNQAKDVEYTVKPKNLMTLYYPTKNSFMQMNLFKRLSKNFKSKPHIEVLGKGTMDLLNGLLNEIDWNKLNKDPVLCPIFQTSLFKIKEHLATAELHQNNYSEFAQQIELVHCEIATLLEIARPFTEADFATHFKKTLTPLIPPNLQCQVGLCKTAVNIFAGINAAVIRQNPQAGRVYSKGFYFEQVNLLGMHHKFENFEGTVDLYAGQFNPNIDITTDHTHYERRDVIADVRTLLKTGKAGKHLTVAIDCTIDKFDSTNVKNLLKEFEKEIQQGKLNFVLFRSGQKLDMFGMDNYYGATYCMVNNGGKQWKEFESLNKDKAYKTDPLSVQWFTLVNKYATDSLRKYRQLIFDNTRTILDQIPTTYNKNLRVPTAAKNMDASFIDIKLTGLNHRNRSFILGGVFYKKMLENKIKLHSRLSFGFYHPNFITLHVVDDSSSIRINPGLNSEENKFIIEYFQNLT